jgi:translocator protein
MQKVSTLKILNVAALVVVLAVNYLANALPINGIDTGTISNKYYNEFAPAGITFSIWGVIYSLIIGLIVWQFIKANEVKNKAIEQFSGYFIANCLLNAAWLFSWHYELFALSVVLMFGILYTLVQLNRIESKKITSELPQKWLPQSAFGIYLGWICIATIANITTFLVSIEFNKLGLTDTFWTGTVIGIGSITAAMLVVRYKNIYIGLAVIWALVGIVIRQNQLHQHFTAISWAALTYGLAVVASLFYGRRS